MGWNEFKVIKICLMPNSHSDKLNNSPVEIMIFHPLGEVKKQKEERKEERKEKEAKDCSKATQISL